MNKKVNIVMILSDHVHRGTQNEESCLGEWLTLLHLVLYSEIYSWGDNEAFN